MNDYSICPIINGISDHDGQSISIYSFNLRPPPKKCRYIWRTNENKINDFLIKLSNENWDRGFSTDVVNMMYNSFLDTYLKSADTCFPLKMVSTTKK